jgi:hypothetical protein
MTRAASLARVAGAAVLIVLTYLALGPLPAIAGAWLLMSPDPIAATGRAGGVGAVGAGAKAAAAYLAQEWRRGGPARARRRSARRDRWWRAGGWRRSALRLEHAVVLAYRGLRSVPIAGSRGVHAMPGGARHATAAAKARRQALRGGPAAHRATTGNTRIGRSGAGPAWTPPPTPQHAATPQSHQPGRSPAAQAPTSPGGHPAAGTPAPTTGGQMSNEDYPAAGGGEVDPTMPGGGELTTTADLRQEIAVVQARIEQAEVLAGQLREWQSGLPDRYQAAAGVGGPQTRGLTEAVNEVTEAAGDGAAFGQGLNALRRACDQADVLGEQADAIGADGHTRGYVPA